MNNQEQLKKLHLRDSKLTSLATTQLLQGMTEYVFCTIEILDLSKSVNFDESQSCEHLAYLVAEAPELKQLNINVDDREESKL